MKEKRKINLSTLENKLSDREMMDVLGRFGYCQADVDCELGTSCIDGVCSGGDDFEGVTICPSCSSARVDKFCCFYNPNGYLKVGRCGYIPFGGWVCNSYDYAQTTF